MYINNLGDVVNKCDNTYHSTVKMKLIDVKLSIYINFNKEKDKEYPRFEVSHHIRILKYKNIFAKGYARNWFEEVFCDKKSSKCYAVDIYY